MELGMKHTVTQVVTEEKTAIKMGSGDTRVFATPALVALMENAAANCIAPYLEQGRTSVGTEISVKHLSATPVGMEVSATAEITAIDGKKISFKITAQDAKGIVGEAVHTRAVLDKQIFQQRADLKDTNL